MMKKLLVSALLLFVTAVTTYAADWTFGWAHGLDSKVSAGDSPSGIVKTADGNYVAFTIWGSTDKDGLNWYMDGEALKDAQGNLIEGSHYTTGTSYAANVGLQKFDAATGKLLWNVYSKNGYADHSNSHVQPMSDGGVLLLLYQRCWDNHLDTVVNLVDAAGTEHVYTSKYNDHKIYMPIAVKLDADGKFVWMKKLFDFSLIEDRKYYPTSLYYSRATAVDDEGNFYVAGTYRSTITFKEGVSITSQNTPATWDGDVQTVNGDLFVAKYDKDGNYQGHIVTEGKLQAAAVQNLTCQGDKLYLQGYIMGGTTPTENTMGGKPFTAGIKQSFLVASVNRNDLSVDYVKMINAESDKNGALQDQNLQYVNGSLYLTGSVQKGNYIGEDGAVVLNMTRMMHTGFIIKMNPQTGEVIASGLETLPSITKFHGVMETKNAEGKEQVVAFGYQFSGGYIASTFTQKDKALVKDATTYLIVSKNNGRLTTTASTVPPLFDNQSVVMIGRVSGNKITDAVVSLYGTDQTLSGYTNWGLALANFSHTALVPTGISSVRPESLRPTLEGWYTLQGVRIAEPTHSGIYIHNGKKVIVRK